MVAAPGLDDPRPRGARHPYADERYVASLGLGGAFAVPEWEGFVLARPIPGGGQDAAGPYPLAVLPQGADLPGGLERLRGAGLVSLVLAPDPLRGPPEAAWRGAFPLRRPFKTHRLVDPRAGAYDPTPHHRARIRRGLRRCTVTREALADRLANWKPLYADLVRAKAMTGPAAFPSSHFDVLAQERRIEAFVASVGGEVAAMTLWFPHDGVVYNHLTASNALGYAHGAAFALYDAAIAHFAGEGVLNLGAGAGLRDDPDDGLAAFKRGFANGEVQGWLCGAVLDPARYAALSAGRDDAFFPAYRGSAALGAASEK